MTTTDHYHSKMKLSRRKPPNDHPCQQNSIIDSNALVLVTTHSHTLFYSQVFGMRQNPSTAVATTKVDTVHLEPRTKILLFSYMQSQTRTGIHP